MKNTYIYKIILNSKYHDPKNWDAAVNEIFQRHFEYLKAGVEAGTAVVVGRTDVSMEKNFGIVIFYADNENAAKDFMNSDPVVKENVMSAELFPFRLSLLGKQAN